MCTLECLNKKTSNFKSIWYLSYSNCLCMHPQEESEELWSSSNDDDLIENTNPIPAPDCSRPVWQLVFFLLLWQSVYRVSNAAITALLNFLLCLSTVLVWHM